MTTQFFPSHGCATQSAPYPTPLSLPCPGLPCSAHTRLHNPCHGNSALFNPYPTSPPPPTLNSPTRARLLVAAPELRSPQSDCATPFSPLLAPASRIRRRISAQCASPRVNTVLAASAPFSPDFPALDSSTPRHPHPPVSSPSSPALSRLFASRRQLLNSPPPRSNPTAQRSPYRPNTLHFRRCPCLSRRLIPAQYSPHRVNPNLAAPRPTTRFAPSLRASRPARPGPPAPDDTLPHRPLTGPSSCPTPLRHTTPAVPGHRMPDDSRPPESLPCTAERFSPAHVRLFASGRP